MSFELKNLILTPTSEKKEKAKPSIFTVTKGQLYVSVKNFYVCTGLSRGHGQLSLQATPMSYKSLL